MEWWESGPRFALRRRKKMKISTNNEKTVEKFEKVQPLRPEKPRHIRL